MRWRGRGLLLLVAMSGCYGTRQVDGDGDADGDVDGDGDGDADLTCGSGDWATPACDSVTGTKGITFVRPPAQPVSNDGALDVQYFVTAGIVPLAGNRLLAIAGDELITSADAGCSWTSLGPIANTQYLTAGGGCRAYSFGRWLPSQRIESGEVTPFGPDVFGDDGLADLWVDPDDDAHLLALHNGDGVLFESTDAGGAWTEIGACPESYVRALSVDASDTNHLACGTHEGIWTSFDGAASWEPSRGLASEPGSPVDELEISPVDGAVVWAVQDQRLYRSEDGAATFAQVLGRDVSEHLRADSADTGRVWYLHQSGLFRYDVGDAGPTMIVRYYRDSGIDSFAQSPADPTLLYLGLEHIWVD